MEQNLVLIGWGRPEYPAAGAAALEGLRGHADVFGTSCAKLNLALSDRAPHYAATYIIGVGITMNIPETVAALRILHKAGKKIHWISRMDLGDAEPILRQAFGDTLGFTKVFVQKRNKDLVSVVADYFQDEGARKYGKFCTAVSPREAKSNQNVIAVYQRLFQAAGYYHREVDDDLLYGRVVKKLWETQKLEALKEDAALMKQLTFFDKYGDDEIVGSHASTKALIARIDQIAPHDSVNVLILGETGTGKELIAKQIHRKSPRAEGPLVVDNCACMDDTLVNTRLFGNEKGAYTGADSLYRGLIEQANGGTLFLDEIGELPLEAQAKLLRALDSHKIARAGGDIANQIDVDFRLVAATNRNLVQRVAEGKFREDLFQRIATVIVQTTPLRERREDIAEIAKHRWPKITRRPDARLSRAQAEVLKTYDYPGNVRELNNILERAHALGESDFAPVIAEQSDMMRTLIDARNAAENATGAKPFYARSKESPFAALPENREELLHLHARYLHDKYHTLVTAAKKAGVSINTFKNQLKLAAFACAALLLGGCASIWPWGTRETPPEAEPGIFVVEPVETNATVQAVQETNVTARLPTPPPAAPRLRIISAPSPNFDARKRPVTALILHYTASPSLTSALRALRNPQPPRGKDGALHRVSAHYVVDVDGTIYKLVDESKRAWHAGISRWRGLDDVNDYSIGIEIVNRGFDSQGRRVPFPSAQIDAVIGLCQTITRRHPAIRDILGHSDIAPTRKVDPGEAFPWKRLAEAGIGYWTDRYTPTTEGIGTILARLGYDTRNLWQTVQAFRRHYHPEGLVTHDLAATTARAKALDQENAMRRRSSPPATCVKTM